MSNQRHFTVNGNLVLENNVILDGKNAAGNPFGGGIVVNTGAGLSIRGAIIRNCKAGVGAGVYIAGGSSVTMSAGAIQNALATRGSGVFIDNGSFQMSGTAVIEGCTATDTETPQGAGVFLGTGTFEMIGSSQIKNCIAIQINPVGAGKKDVGNGQGGGIFVSNNGTAVIGGGTSTPVISGNIAHAKIDFTQQDTVDWGGLGGGLYSDDGNVTIYPGTVFRDCHASNNGGAVYVTNADFSIKGGTITGCTAANGGGVFIKDKASTITALDISNCDAIYQGGAFAVIGTQVTLGPGVDITQCSAGTPYYTTWWSGKGGGVYVSDGAKLIMQGGSTISNCSAVTTENQYTKYATLFGSGGGIYIDSDGQASLTGVSITDCSADHHGGGIFVKKYENLTTQNISFQGNSAYFYRVPSDNVVSGLYPSCSSAVSISLNPADLENRVYPLNNYDINHFSFAYSYYGNGGVDLALPAPHNVYRGFDEFTGFRTLETAGNATHTVYSNNRLENGNLFEFRKNGSEYGATSNYDIYRPDEQYFFTYGPTQAYDPYPYTPARPTFTEQTIYESDLMAVKQPEMKFFMLYTKNLKIEKKVNAQYDNLTKKFDIDLKIFDLYANSLASLDKSYSFKHGESDTIRMYDSVLISVEENAASAAGYNITYSDGITNSATFIKKPLDSYTQIDVVLTVNNAKVEPVPTGVFGLKGAEIVFAVGLSGVLGLLVIVIYRRRRRL